MTSQANQAARARARAECLAEEVQWMLDQHEGWGPILKAVGYHDATSLARVLYRRGYPDLARRVEHFARIEDAA